MLGKREKCILKEQEEIGKRGGGGREECRNSEGAAKGGDR